MHCSLTIAKKVTLNFNWFSIWIFFSWTSTFFIAIGILRQSLRVFIFFIPHSISHPTYRSSCLQNYAMLKLQKTYQQRFSILNSLKFSKCVRWRWFVIFFHILNTYCVWCQHYCLITHVATLRSLRIKDIKEHSPSFT